METNMPADSARYKRYRTIEHQGQALIDRDYLSLVTRESSMSHRLSHVRESFMRKSLQREHKPREEKI